MPKRFRTSKLVPLEPEKTPRFSRFNDVSANRRLRHVFRVSKPNSHISSPEFDPIVTPIFSADKDSYQIPESNPRQKANSQLIPNNSQVKFQNTPYNLSSSCNGISTQKRCRITTGKRNEVVETPKSQLQTPFDVRLNRKAPVVSRRLTMSASPAEQTFQNSFQHHQKDTPLGSGGLLSQHSQLQIESAYSSSVDSAHQQSTSSHRITQRIVETVKKSSEQNRDGIEKAHATPKKILDFDADQKEKDAERKENLLSSKRKTNICSSLNEKKERLQPPQPESPSMNEINILANVEESQNIDELQNVEIEANPIDNAITRREKKNCKIYSPKRYHLQSDPPLPEQYIFEQCNQNSGKKKRRVSRNRIGHDGNEMMKKETIEIHKFSEESDGAKRREKISGDQIIISATDSSEESVPATIRIFRNKSADNSQSKRASVDDQSDHNTITPRSNKGITERSFEISPISRNKNAQNNTQAHVAMKRKRKNEKKVLISSQTESDISTVPPSPVKNIDIDLMQNDNMNQEQDDLLEQDSHIPLSIVHVERSYMHSARIQIGAGVLSSPPQHTDSD